MMDRDSVIGRVTEGAIALLSPESLASIGYLTCHPMERLRPSKLHGDPEPLLIGYDGEPFLAGGIGLTVVESHKRKTGRSLLGRSQEGGQLQRIRGAQRVSGQKPVGSRTNRFRREDDRRRFIEVEKPPSGCRQLRGCQFSRSRPPIKRRETLCSRRPPDPAFPVGAEKPRHRSCPRLGDDEGDDR